MPLRPAFARGFVIPEAHPMPDEFGERVATLEANIKTQNGLLKSIRDDQREMRKEIQRLTSSLSFFKGAWSVVTLVLAALAAWWGAHFGKS